MPKGTSLIFRVGAVLLTVTLGACGQPGGGQPPAAGQGAQESTPQAPAVESTAVPAPTGAAPEESGSAPSATPAPTGAAPEESGSAPSATPAPTGAGAAPTRQPAAPSATPASSGVGTTPTRQPAAPTAVAPASPAATAALPIPEVSVAPVPPAAGVTGEVPLPVVQALVADLAGRLGVDPAAIRVSTAEAVTWPDGSLGCPQPGMAYPQVLTEGYRVVLAVGEATYLYHGATAGGFVLCERPRP